MRFSLTWLEVQVNINNIALCNFYYRRDFMPQAVRLDDELIEQARAEITVTNRSLGGQIEQWARIGRAVERAPGFDYSRVKAALRAELSTDELTRDEQLVFNEEFSALLHKPSEIEDAFFAKMREEGRGVGLDENDELVYGRNEPEYEGE